jgi:hypothetical protein
VAVSNSENNLNSTSRRSAANAGASTAFAGHSRMSVVWIGVVFFLAALAVGVFSSPALVSAAITDGQVGLDCVGCHSVPLGAHSKLGSGNQGCQACHSSTDMLLLRLANGAGLPLVNSPLLCAQCHQSRYTAWVSGTHGFPGFREGMSPGSSDGATTCTACHDPHEPRIAFDFTKAHPAAAPSPAPVPRDLVLMVGISLAVLGGAVAYTLSGRGRS